MYEMPHASAAKFAAVRDAKEIASFFRSELTKDFGALRHTFTNAYVSVDAIDQHTMIQLNTLLNVAESLINKALTV